MRTTSTTTLLSLHLQPPPFFKCKLTSPSILLHNRHRHGRTRSDNLTLTTRPDSLPSLRLSVHCLLPTKPIDSGSVRAPSNPIHALARAVTNALEALKKPAISVILLGLLLMYATNPALAASGGRMGGSSFSSRSSSKFRWSSGSRSRSGSGFSSPRRCRSGESEEGSQFSEHIDKVVLTLLLIILVVLLAAIVFIYINERQHDAVAATVERSVLKVQVGLLGTGRALQRDLDRIAQTTDTSTPAGFRSILTETTLSLLRYPEYCISGYSAVDLKRSMEGAEKRFEQLSNEERGKFDEETLVNVNNVKKQSTSSQRASGVSNEYIVITILVAAEGLHTLPSINNGRDLKEALQKLESIPSSQVLAVEVSWTPQDENDTLSERKLVEDYPLLRPFCKH